MSNNSLFAFANESRDSLASDLSIFDDCEKPVPKYKARKPSTIKVSVRDDELDDCSLVCEALSTPLSEYSSFRKFNRSSVQSNSSSNNSSLTQLPANTIPGSHSPVPSQLSNFLLELGSDKIATDARKFKHPHKDNLPLKTHQKRYSVSAVSNRVISMPIDEETFTFEPPKNSYQDLRGKVSDSNLHKLSSKRSKFSLNSFSSLNVAHTRGITRSANSMSNLSAILLKSPTSPFKKKFSFMKSSKITGNEFPQDDSGIITNSNLLKYRSNRL